MGKIMAVMTIVLSCSLANVIAGVEVNEFDNKLDSERFKVLVNELRCLVCQNQNLADSNAELAQDLRKEVYLMIKKGQSNDEIVDFMVVRYGDFVLYKPPFKAETFILWVGPFLILLFAVIFLIIFIRKNNRKEITSISDTEKSKAESLIQSISSEKE